MFYNFNEDLPLAKKTEEEVQNIFRQRGYEIISTCNDCRYDFSITKNNYTYYIEVKEDLMSAETGRWIVEYYSRGKDSGILTTQAHYYCEKLYYPDFPRFIMIKVNLLKEWIKNKLYWRTNVPCGDNKSGLGHLFTLEFVKQEILKSPKNKSVFLLKKLDKII